MRNVLNTELSDQVDRIDSVSAVTKRTILIGGGILGAILSLVVAGLLGLAVILAHSVQDNEDAINRITSLENPAPPTEMRIQASAKRALRACAVDPECAQQFVKVLNKGLKLPDGLQGKSGASGIQGGAGPSGPSGVQGPRGVPGASGSPGARGPSGATGARGPVGPRGATGRSGPAGPQGPAGAIDNTQLEKAVAELRTELRCLVLSLLRPGAPC